MKEKYDIVIIGSGLGGLLCGLMLSRDGYKVCILEKNEQPGGSLQTFRRKNCEFETGMHYIGSLDEGQVMNQFFKYFNILDDLKVKRLDEDGFDILNIGGKEYKYAMGYEPFQNQLNAYFPAEKEPISNYIQTLKKVSDSAPLYNLRVPDLSNLKINEYLSINAYDYIKSLTSNIDLQNVLAGLNFNYAGSSKNTPLYVHALINNYFIKSAYRFIGGSDQVSKLLEKQIRANGGTIITGFEAKELVFRDQKLVAVEDTKGERMYANSFISNMHPSQTLEMIEPGKVRPSYARRIHSLENTISSFTLHLSLKKDTFKYRNANYLYFKRNNVWTIDSYDEKTWPENYFFFFPVQSEDMKYANCASVLSYMKFDELKRWENTTEGNRGDDYNEWKKGKAEKLLALVYKQFPELKGNIQEYYASTPLTYRDHLGTPEGSIYGIMRKSTNPIESVISPKTNIPNLYFTGQNINLHGMLGVTLSSVLTAGEFLGVENLVKSIRNA